MCIFKLRNRKDQLYVYLQNCIIFSLISLYFISSFFSILFYSSLFELFLAFFFNTFDILIVRITLGITINCIAPIKITRAITNVNMTKKKKKEERRGEKRMPGMMINGRSIRTYQNQCECELFVNENTRERKRLILTNTTFKHYIFSLKFERDK